MYGYDLSGNMQFRTDASGNTTTYTLDALSRTTAEQNELADVRAMAYNSAGNLIQRTDRDGRVTRYEYDDLNRKTAETWLDSNGNVIRTFSFTFYADGKMASASDSGGITTLFTYDAMGRVHTVDQTLPADASKHYVLTYGYDQDSRLTSLAGTVANLGLVDLTYGYDAAGWLTSIIDDAGDKRVIFAYNSLGQYVTLTRYADAAGTELVASSSYGYDDSNRLTSLIHALNDSGETTLAYALQYDVAGRITQLTTPDGASDLTLDNQGQLTGASLTDEDYTYDANGNRTSGGTVTGADNRILEDSTYTYSYDDEGNLTSRTAKDASGSRTFTWDYRNRLTQVVTKDGEGTTTLTALYAYDAFDRRIRKTVSGSQSLDEQYLYDGTTDGDCLLVLDGSGNVKLRQLRGLSSTEVFAEDRINGGTTATRWTLADHQGSVRDVVDNSAAVVDHIQYDSFGKIIAQTNAAEASRAGYTGAPTDSETGFVYLYHRYFDPRSGRFISQDPSGFGAGDANLYRYCRNRPLDATDTVGLGEDGKESHSNALGSLEETRKTLASGQYGINDLMNMDHVMRDLGASTATINTVLAPYRSEFYAKVKYSTGDWYSDASRAWSDAYLTGWGNAAEGAKDGITNVVTTAVIDIPQGLFSPYSDSFYEANSPLVAYKLQNGFDAVPVLHENAQLPQQFMSGDPYEIGKGFQTLSSDAFLGAAVIDATGLNFRLGVPSRVSTNSALAAENAPKLPASETWGNPDTLAQHFEDHGGNFGATIPKDYANQASQFLQDSQANGLPTKIDVKGTIRVYDPETNTFGSYNANGTTKTFFQPTSPTYWSRQFGVSPTIIGGNK